MSKRTVTRRRLDGWKVLGLAVPRRYPSSASVG